MEENNFLAPLFSKIAKCLATWFGLYTLIQVVFLFLMPKALWPLMFLEMIGPISATALAYTWHKNMEEEIEEQHQREIMQEMEEENYEVYIEFNDEEEAEFYFKNEEAMESLIQKIIEAAKLKEEQENLGASDQEDEVTNEEDKENSQEQTQDCENDDTDNYEM